ncbi:cation:proton antiporter [Acuticoccus sediminis]|uniref:Cation:proton antiporter n=1 Tax=Acuticoccus sediminis TaxID=2184697 RepID=A0A8B2NR29_9HYPH|nr:NADH-quinone oxidoreductase subunit K [Acuticoccus sediminis]RAI02345.1 cation:proton antiporter [Acuticoccus sediminis]
MNLVYALAIAAIVGTGVYLVLSRNVMRIILGVSLLSAGTNLLIFLAGGVQATLPPVIEQGSDMLRADSANPLPQALILTAIVIGFALVAFSAALALQLFRTGGTIDTRELTAAEDLGSPFEPKGASHG